MTLVPGEFIRRFLLHVLPKGFHRIRHYGLLASAARKANIARVRELLAHPSRQRRPTRRPATATAPRPSSPCPCCGGRMIVIETFERGGGPRDPPRPNPGSGPRPHDPRQSLVRIASPPEAIAAGDRPTDTLVRLIHDLDRRSHRHRPAGRARPHSAPRRSRSLRRPSDRAPPSNLSPTPPPTVAPIKSP